jgi:4'-phosphopantetheinyl transferase
MGRCGKHEPIVPDIPSPEALPLVYRKSGKCPMMNADWLVPATHPPLAAEEAHVWAVRLLAAASQLDTVSAILSPEELQRAADFRLDPPRQHFVVARGALRMLLSRYLDVEPASVQITVDANNKPRLADQHAPSTLRFNVAHSHTLALIAVTHGSEIGVDLERLRHVRHAEHIARRYFHPAEIAAIVSAPPATRDATFLRIWTGKEAVLKAIGTGITGSLAAFCVPREDEEPHYEAIDVPTNSPAQSVRCWLRRLVVDDEYEAAFATVGQKLGIRRLTFAFKQQSLS